MTAAPRKPVFAGLERKELAVLAAYVLMLVFTLFFYQQSEDEGQAWIITRTYGLGELLFHMLRILGHPALYYLLLWVPAHLGAPLTWLNWPFALIATTGIYLLLRYSPFPFYLRAVLPFGFALGYQYAIVARSYVLIPPLGFLAAYLYRERPLKPLRIAICLALLANVSIHGTMIAVGFAIAYALRLRKLRKAGAVDPAVRRQARLGAALFVASLIFVLVCIWPAKYLHFSSFRSLAHAARRALGPIDKGQPPAGLQPVVSPTASASPAATGAPAASAADLDDPNPPQATLRGRLWLTFAYPVATFVPLAVLFELLVLVYLLRRRLLVFVLPFALLAYFLISVYEQIWHVELMWVTLILILWAAWDAEQDLASRPPWASLQGIVAIAFALLAALQLPWTVGAIRYDMTHASYPAKGTMEYLKTLPPGLRIDGNGLAFRVLPYFPNYIFVDHGSDRFLHAGEPPPPLPISVFNDEKADVLLIRDKDVKTPNWTEINRDGWTVRHIVCGAPYFPNRPIVPICMLIFRR
jgi:hypothetical protein